LTAALQLSLKLFGKLHVIQIAGSSTLASSSDGVPPSPSSHKVSASASACLETISNCTKEYSHFYNALLNEYILPSNLSFHFTLPSSVITALNAGQRGRRGSNYGSSNPSNSQSDGASGLHATEALLKLYDLSSKLLISLYSHFALPNSVSESTYTFDFIGRPSSKLEPGSDGVYLV
jgi:hypothetical protein